MYYDTYHTKIWSLTCWMPSDPYYIRINNYYMDCRLETIMTLMQFVSNVLGTETFKSTDYV